MKKEWEFRSYLISVVKKNQTYRLHLNKYTKHIKSLKTSGFIERLLAHDICHAAVFTVPFANMTILRKGNSIYMCWPKTFVFLFYWIFPFEHRDFSKDHLFICYEKMWKSCQNSIVCALPCLFNMSVIAPKITL